MNIIKVFNSVVGTRFKCELVEEILEVKEILKNNKTIKCIQTLNGNIINIDADFINAEYELDWDYCSEKYNVDFTEFVFNWLDETDELEGGICEGLNVKWYADKRFNVEQMRAIREGLSKGLDVSWYADPKFNSYQMKEILFGLENNFDVSLYANEKFTSFQMYNLVEALVKGIDISSFAKPEISEKDMETIINILNPDARCK